MACGTAPADVPKAENGSECEVLGSVETQLARLTAFPPAYGARVRRVHEGLVEAGYLATVPAPRKADRAPAYLAMRTR